MTRYTEPKSKPAPFVPGRTYVDLTFENTEGYEGLVVNVRKPKSLEFVKLINSQTDLAEIEPGRHEQADVLIDLVEMLTKAIRRWNLHELPDDADEDDPDVEPVPVPVTIDTVGGLDFEILTDLLGGWLQSGIGVSGPLDESSTGSEPTTLQPVNGTAPDPDLEQWLGTVQAG